MGIQKIEIDDTSDTKNVELPPEYLLGLKNLFKIVVDFLKENDIEYFIEGGTLLGCVRDKGQIKWDDDCDLGMIPKHFNNLLKIIHKLNMFVIDKSVNGYIRIIDPNTAYTRNILFEDEKGLKETPPRYACIDIFEYTLIKKYYTLSNIKLRNQFHNAIFKKDCLYPLKEYDYEDFKVMGCAIPEQYLDDCYGNWKKRNVYIYS